MKIKAEELEKKFDDGEDVTRYLDVARARRPGHEQRRVNVDFPTWMIERLDRRNPASYAPGALSQPLRQIADPLPVPPDTHDRCHLPELSEPRVPPATCHLRNIDAKSAARLVKVLRSGWACDQIQSSASNPEAKGSTKRTPSTTVPDGRSSVKTTSIWLSLAAAHS